MACNCLGMDFRNARETMLFCLQNQVAYIDSTLMHHWDAPYTKAALKGSQQHYSAFKTSCFWQKQRECIVTSRVKIPFNMADHLS